MAESNLQHTNSPLCRLPAIAPRRFEPGLNPRRSHFLTILQNTWVNGTRLHYHFLENPPSNRVEEVEIVRKAFAQWKSLDIGLEFQEVQSAPDAEIRISFRNDGSWSYVGRQALDIIDPREPTMNFGWSLATPYGYDTALHEIGHALGLVHEHQNRNAGIVWNREAVLAYFSAPPNQWSPEEIQHNILDRVQESGSYGSSWDPDSIMHYPFEAGLINLPAKYRSEPLIPAGGISAVDKSEIRRTYPALSSPGHNVSLPAFQSMPIAIDPGQQLDFSIKPEQTRDYTIATFGQLDTTMVLFEVLNGVPRFVAGDDDGGVDRNAQIVQRLTHDREYRLSIRLYFAAVRGDGALMMW